MSNRILGQQISVPQIYIREDVLAVAWLAEQSEQYDDMIALLKPYVENKVNEDLDFEERNILSVAYKNAVGMRRIAWRAIKKASTYYKKYSPFINEYMNKIEEECVEICKDMLNLIQKHLLPKAKKYSQDVES